MHHLQVEVGCLVWVRLAKNIYEVITNLTQLEKLFYFGI